MNNMKEILMMLRRPSWTAKDIVKYGKLSGEKIGLTKATEIKKKLEVKGHAAPYRKAAIKTDAIMNYFGTSRTEEINLIIKTLKELPDA